MTKARAFKSHKNTAWAYAKGAGSLKPEGRVDIHFTIAPKTRHAIDADNAVAAMKAYVDGIALALGVNDSVFNAPTIAFAEPVKGGSVTVWVKAL